MTRLLLAGATGVIGLRLVPLLVEGGFEVIGMTRSAGKAEDLRAAGAEPLVCDVFERERLIDSVATLAPEIVLHELTDLPDSADELAAHAGRNIRIRTEGTRNLVDAARAGGATRFLAQSVAWDLGGDGEAAKQELERLTLDYPGVVLRYGQFYGPGTFHERAPSDGPAIQIDEAARRTIEVIDAEPGIIEIVEAVPGEQG